MNLKQLIIIIYGIVIRKHLQCYAKVPHDFSQPTIGKSNKINSNGNMFNDLYDVMGISNCSYDQTINITQNAEVLQNGKYIYNSETLIPPQLVGNYDYEILYNGTRRKVPQHKRACICQVKPCISVCSNDILDTYQHYINTGIYDELDIFSIEMTLNNGSVVTRNIVVDFEPILLKDFCEASNMLSPEQDITLHWTLFENGTLLRHSDEAQLNRTEYCFDIYQNDNNNFVSINPRICASKQEGSILLGKLNYGVQLFAIICLLLIILLYLIAYCCLPELQTLQVKCFLTYVCSLVLFFGIICFTKSWQINSHIMPYTLMAYLEHYFLLFHYTWLAIICCVSNNNYLYFTYARCGFLLPFLMTLLTAVARCINVNEFLKPEVNKWAVSIFIYGSCLILLVYCLMKFMLTSKLKPTGHNKKDTELNNSNIEYKKADASCCFQPCLILVLCWLFDLLSYLCMLFDSPALWDYVTATQAVFILLSFILQPELRNVWHKKSSGELKTCASLETEI